MQITLCEDDGIFHHGIPTMVVLVVKFDDGKQKRIPYAADRSIATLYEDLNSISSKVTGVSINDVEELENLNHKPITLEDISRIPVEVERLSKNKPSRLLASIDKSNIIEKEDIVTLINLDEGRNKDATCSLIVGQELRVIGVISTGVTLPGTDEITKIVQGYDVVNDKGDRPERTRVFPNEVALLRKRTAPVIVKNNAISEILNCTHCNAPNALVLDGDCYKGECTDCHLDISISRVIKVCRTDKCGNDVSCFDVGGKYKGKCNKCQSIVEVPYA